MSFLSRMLSAAVMGAAVLASAPVIAQDDESLSIEVFNPGAKSLFPVTSTLVTGPTEAVLIDAQFQKNDAQAVLKLIQKSGKKLKTIYISHGDPDYYFGLDVITAAYPDAKIVASPSTVSHIRKTVQAKVSYWGPILAENAPTKTITPDLFEGDTLTVDGQELRIIGLEGHDPKHTYVWIPALKTITGGVVVYEGVHVWMADMKTAESRDKWCQTLSNLLALKPERIIPGHVIGSSRENTDSINFTLSYMAAFEEEMAKAANSTELIAAMKARYPNFTNTGDLELSAKVVMGEMQWP